MLAEYRCKKQLKCYKVKHTGVKWPISKRPKIDFQKQSLLNAGQKYCRIKIPFVIKIFALSILEWPFYPGFTVICILFEGDILICNKKEWTYINGITVFKIFI